MKLGSGQVALKMNKMPQRLVAVIALVQLLSHSTFVQGVADDEDDRWSPSDWEVAELTDETFDAWIVQHPRAVVDFYASWCRHCKHLSPEMDKAAPLLAASTPPIAVAKIDADKNKKIAKQYDISQFPVIKVFENGKPVLDYEGERSAAAMVGHARRLFFPDLTVLDSSPTSFDTFMKETIPDGDSAPIFLILGLLDEDKVEAITLSAAQSKHLAYFVQHPAPPPELLQAFGILQGPPAFAAFRPKYNEKEVFTGSFEKAHLEAFVRNNLLPLMTPLDGESHHAIINNGRHVALAILDGAQTSESTEFVRLCRKMAAGHRNYTFASVDATEYPEFVKQFQPKEAQTWLPYIVVWDMDTKFFAPESAERLRGYEAELALDSFLTDVEKDKAKAQSTTGPTLWDQVMYVVNSPTFPFYIVSMVMIAGIILVRRLPDAEKPGSAKDKAEEKAEEKRARGTSPEKQPKKGKAKNKSPDGEKKKTKGDANETAETAVEGEAGEKEESEKKDD